MSRPIDPRHAAWALASRPRHHRCRRRSARPAAGGRGPPREWDILAVVAVGGAIGAEGRYALGVLWPDAATSFPWTTLLVNVARLPRARRADGGAVRVPRHAASAAAAAARAPACSAGSPPSRPSPSTSSTSSGPDARRPQRRTWRSACSPAWSPSPLRRRLLGPWRSCFQRARASDDRRPGRCGSACRRTDAVPRRPRRAGPAHLALPVGHVERQPDRGVDLRRARRTAARRRRRSR